MSTLLFVLTVAFLAIAVRGEAGDINEVDLFSPGDKAE